MEGGNKKYYMKEEEYANHYPLQPPPPAAVDEERENSSSENSGDSPPSPTTFAISSSSPKRGRRAIQKRVVTVPLKDADGSRLKGDSITPPSDSWAWRKYGQKPIKGSPYPRGYYRCSSSKGCPARKQVERSRTSPSTLVITYSYEHNHPWPTSKNHHHHHHQSTTPPSKTTKNDATSTKTTTATTNVNSDIDRIDPKVSTPFISHDPPPPTTYNIPPPSNYSNNVVQGKLIADFEDESLIPTDVDFTWFPDAMSSSSSASSFHLDRSSFFTKTVGTSSTARQDYDMIARLFPMREEDESLFADLGELPECSTVFGRGTSMAASGGGAMVVDEEEYYHRRCNNFTTWCGTTS